MPRNVVSMYTNCTNINRKILLDKSDIVCYTIIKIRQQAGHGETVGTKHKALFAMSLYGATGTELNAPLRIFPIIGGVLSMAKSTRTRWFRLVLYPDNIYHQQIMEYLNSEKNPYQGCYILHKPETDEKKEHWHVALYFPNCRTKAGVIKMFGKGEFRKTENGLEPCADKTGIDESEIEIADLVGEMLVEPVSDIHSTAMYFLHKTFASIREKKTEYAISDIKAFNNDFELVNSLFELDKTTSAGSQLQEIIQYIETYNIKDMKELVCTLYMNNPLLVRYVEAHSYLIKTLLG